MEVGSTSARLSPRVGSVAVYAAGPVAIVAVWWLRRQGLLAATPIWLLALIILGTGACNLGTSVWLARRATSTWRLHLRVATSALCTAAVIYAAGWGSVLVIAYALGSAELMRTVGPRAVRASIVWNSVAVLIGELAVAIGVAPTMISPSLGHTIAVAGAICLAIVTDVLARTATAARTAEARVRERGEYFESLIERAADIIGVISTDGTVRSVSPAVRDTLGYAPAEVQGRPITMFLHPEQESGLHPLLESIVRDRGEVVRVEARLVHRDGTDRLAIVTLTSPSPEWGDRIVVNLHDITTQRTLEQQLRHDARYDVLTGLLNRKAFGEESERICASALRHGWTIGLLFIDLDGFKSVNDSFGHDVGDRVLVETADRLAACLRQNEILARLGGDEFAVLLGSVDDAGTASAVAERILEAISMPFPGLPAHTRIGASIGIALRSPDGIEIASMMSEADEAMYAAKRNGRSRWELSPAADLRADR